MAEPARFADQILGVLTAGYPVDDQMAEELAERTRIEVSFLSDGQVVGTSLPRSELPRLLELRANESSQSRPGQVPPTSSDNQGSYLGKTYPLTSPGDAQGHAIVLMADWRPTAQVLDQLRARLLWIALGTFGVAIGGLLVFGRRLSRPLKVIAEAAEDIAGGNWDRRVPGQGGAEAGVMASAFNDMTRSLVHWRAQAGAHTEQLQASYERFRSVTQSASDGIISIDHMGAIAFWNPGAVRLFGYGEAEAIGKPTIQLISPVDQHRYTEFVRAFSNAAEAPTAVQSVELRGVSKDGSEFSFSLSLARWVEGTETGFTAVIRDVTEQVEERREER